MKTNSIRLISAAAVTAAIFFISSCKPVARDGGLVEISCEQEFEVLNHANLEVGGSDAEGKYVVYTTGPNFFTGGIGGTEGAAYLYMPEDGNQVELRIDGDILYVNGIARSVYIDTDNPRNFATWYETADTATLKSLRTILFDGENDFAFEKEFREIRSINPHALILLEEEPFAAQPYLFSDDCFPTNEPTSARVDLSETRVLILNELDDDMLDIFTRKKMPNLHRILVASTPNAQELLRATPQVKAVTLLDGDEDEPSNLRHLINLEELHIPEDIAMDFGQLPNPEMLRALTINITTNVTGLEKLTHLEYLNPGSMKMSGEQLATLIANHPNLVYLNLLYADVETLEPLKNAKRLEAITLGEFKEDTAPDFAPLESLKHLRYVGLPENLRKPEVLSALREACPQIVVFQHDKFCLGSGWLTLLLPVFLIFLLLKRARSRACEGVE